MTTVAYKDGVLAGDTRITCGDLITPERATKVFKLSNGALLGAAGTLRNAHTLRRAIENGHPLPDVKGVDAVMITPDGTIYCYDRDAWNEINAPYHAIGSGCEYAYTALWLGHDAITAVKAGIQFDKNSGGKVMAVRLKEKK